MSGLSRSEDMTERERQQHARELSAALKEGKLPTTQQATAAIEKIQKEGLLRDTNQELSREGQRVAASAEHLLDDSKRILAEKNAGDQLQQAVYYGVKAAQQTTSTASNVAAGGVIDTETAAQAKEHIRETYERALELARIIVSRPGFRRFLDDASSIVQDILRYNLIEHGGQTGQAIAREMEKPQSGIKEGTQAGIEEYRQQPGTGPQVVDSAYASQQNISGESNEPFGNVKSQINTGMEQGQAHAEEWRKGNTSTRDATKRAVDTVADVMENVVPPETRESVSRATQPHVERYRSGEVSATQAAQEGLRELKISSKQTAQAAREKIAQLEIPQEKIDELIERLKDAFRDIQDDPYYQYAVEDLIAVVKELSTKATGMVQQAVEQVKPVSETTQQREARIATENARQLVENFAGGRSLQPIIDSVLEIKQRLMRDPDLKDYLNDVNTFINRSMTDRTYLDTQDFKGIATDLMRRAFQLRDEKLGGPMDRLSKETSAFVTALQNDEATNVIRKDLEDLAQNLFLDSQGRPTFKPELAKDFVKILPKLADRLGYIPISRIEHSDEDITYIVDNLVLKCSQITPKYLRIETDTAVDVINTQKSHNVITFHISKIQATARDVVFLYNKKTGFPKMGDTGIADLDILDDGVQITMTLEPDMDPKSPNTLRVKYCKVHIDSLKLRIRDSKHDVLYKVMSPFINTFLKKKVESSTEDTLRNLIFRLDEKVKGMSTTGRVGHYRSEYKPLPKTGIPEWGSKAYSVTEE